jgi:putative transposase
MIRSFKYRLKPTIAQEATLLSWIEACRQLYNAALQQRQEAYKKQGKSLRKYDQYKDLTELKQSDEFWWNIPVEALRSSLDRLHGAFEIFFKRIVLRQKSGYPRFKSKDRYKSISFNQDFFIVDGGGKVHVPKLGIIKFNQYRPMSGRIGKITICFNDSKWWIFFACEISDIVKLPIDKTKVIGIDLGLKTFAMTSTNKAIKPPRFFRKSQENITRLSRILAKKKKGSNRRRKIKLLLSKAHEHVRNQRLDFARKLAVYLFYGRDIVCYEKLQIQEMIDNKIEGMTTAQKSGMNKSIYDAAWLQVINSIIYKAENAGKYAIGVDPRGTSQECNKCGKIVKKDLSIRIHSCPYCGLTIDRDLNAAINIEKRGLRLLGGIKAEFEKEHSLERVW